MKQDAIFWDVDTQRDFMDADGKLYVPDAEAIKGNLDRLTRYAHVRGIRIVATADDHVPGHRELSDMGSLRPRLSPQLFSAKPSSHFRRATTTTDFNISMPTTCAATPVKRTL